MKQPALRPMEKSLHHPLFPVLYIHSLRRLLRQAAALEVEDMIVSDFLILHRT